MDELARKLGMDPIVLRAKNGARNGVKASYGPTFANLTGAAPSSVILAEGSAVSVHSGFRLPAV